MKTSILEEELAQLNAQIELVRKKRRALEGKQRAVAEELGTFSADQQRFDALREVLNALDKLGELKADKLFWEGVAEAKEAAGHVEQVRSRVARFEGEISGILEKQASLKEQIDRCLDELDVLDEEVRDAYARAARRQDEYVIVREISPVPHRTMIMPWSTEAESEERFRRALRVAFLFFLLFGTVIPLWKMPVPERPAVVLAPERVVSLLKNEPPKPGPLSERPVEEKSPEKKEKEDRPQPTTAETQASRKKVESTGVLAFKDSFSDLMDETSGARLGAEARLSKENPQAKGQATSQRSLVAMQAKGGTSGGLGNTEASRNVGSGSAGKIGGGEGFVRVESGIAGLGGGSSGPTGAGLVPSRTDEEIQIVFDRYKAALYRIYNVELRKNPTLRGKILMRITIEPDGAVSLCKVESTDLASPELVAKILERIQKFNFGPKEGVKRTTILYPIEFFPGG